MLSHVDSANRPTMVDVGDKAVTRRMAVARATVVFPPDVAPASGETLRTKKGPVFDTAIVAGVMAAKRTHDLIPFCHPIPLEDCHISIDWGDGGEVVIECSVRATHKTGVEMEALTGAATAALTVYDMCKALTHGIRITELSLVSKTGGRRDYLAATVASADAAVGGAAASIAGEIAGEAAGEASASMAVETADDAAGELSVSMPAETAGEAAVEAAAESIEGGHARTARDAGRRR